MYRTQGFTLIELMATVAMAAIVLTLGVPSMQSTINSNRASSYASRLITALNLARSEAVKRGVPVTVCKANLSGGTPDCDANDCDGSSGASCWEKGWLVFVDANGNGVLNEDADKASCAGDECTLRVFEALPDKVTLRPLGTDLALWISYRASGSARGSGPDGDGSIVNDTFRLCAGTDGIYSRSIAIATGGRARVYKGTEATPCP